MGTDQAWDVVATPRDRWCLAAVLAHPDLKFKTRKEQKSLARARAALDLVEMTERFLDGGKGRVPLSEDTRTYRKFSVSAETAEFIIESVGRFPEGLSGGNLAGLEPLLAQLEDRAHAEKMCERQPEARAGEVVEDWSRTNVLAIDDPTKLTDELNALATECQKADYDVRVLVDGLKAATERSAAPVPKAA